MNITSKSISMVIYGHFLYITWNRKKHRPYIIFFSMRKRMARNKG